MSLKLFNIAASNTITLTNQPLTVDALNRLINNGKQILLIQIPQRALGGGTYSTVDDAKYEAWRSQVLEYVKSRLTDKSEYFKALGHTLPRGSNYPSHVETGISILEALLQDLATGTFEHQDEPLNAIQILTNMCQRFHRIATQLRARHNERDTLDITDEYDVQDLLHSLLHLYFDDIRPEDVAPDYGGTSSRIDFSLREYNIVLEAKMTRPNLRDKLITEQLISDTARYQTYPYCKQLFCFVYDPNEYLKNPRAIERDLSGQKDKVKVTVVIRPNH